MKKLISVILAFSLIFIFSACSDTTGAKYTVGICEYTDHTAQSEAILGFTEYLTEKLGDDVAFDVQSAANDANLATTIINTFVSNNVDLIIADNTQSLQIAANTTFDIPVLGVAITDYNTALGLDPDGINISGTSDLAPLDIQAEIITELFPECETVALVYCSSEVNSLYQVNAVQEYLSKEGIIAKEYPFSDANDITLTLEKACDDADVIYLPTDNTLASCIEVVGSICTGKNVPVIAGEEGMCRAAGVATASIDYYALGRKTGEMAYRVLTEGASTNNMPVEYPENAQKMFNRELCEKMGITIPEGYTPLD